MCASTTIAAAAGACAWTAAANHSARTASSTLVTRTASRVVLHVVRQPNTSSERPAAPVTTAGFADGRAAALAARLGKTDGVRYRPRHAAAAPEAGRRRGGSSAPSPLASTPPGSDACM